MSSNQLNESRQHEAANANNNETSSNASGDGFKRPHLKMLNLMKPSLSLTSLPPQSPKEPNEDTNPERPYNSLKVRPKKFRNLNVA
jgi:hypothetical protein